MKNMNSHTSKKSPLGGFRGLLLVLVFFIGCKEEGRNDHIDRSGSAPAQVTNVNVRNTPGGAVLTYTVPSDKNLLCVRAEYEIQPGVVRETKSSFYKDSLVLEGFGDTSTHDVKLFSIGTNEKVSEPLTVQVNPLTPPVKMAEINLVENFSGVRITVHNPYKTNLAIVLMGDTAHLGYQTTLQTFFTSKENATFAYRGLDTIAYDFSVYLRDRWNNLSNTIKANLTPLYEIEIPDDTWREYDLPGDAPAWEGHTTRYLWNGIWEGNMSGWMSDFVDLPALLTVDLGKPIIMSRFAYWPRADIYDVFTRGHPRILEVWGSLDPNPNGDLDETWIPLGRYETIKPTEGPPTWEDVSMCMYPNYPFVLEVEPNAFSPDPFVPIRYLRVRIMATYDSSSMSWIMIQGIKLWGTFVN